MSEDAFIFERAPQSFDEDIIHPAPLAVHGDTDAGVGQDADEAKAGCAKLQTEADEAKAGCAKAQDDLTAAKARADKAQADLAKAQSTIDSLQPRPKK